MDAISVKLSRPKLGEVGVPYVIRRILQRNPMGLLGLLRLIEQTEIHLRGVLRK